MDFYRYELVSFAEYGHELQLKIFKLVKETPSGYWICRDYNFSYLNKDIPVHKNGLCKWIPKKSKKRFAYPDKKDALTNYIKRTEFYIKILNSSLEKAKVGLSQAKNLKEK